MNDRLVDVGDVIDENPLGFAQKIVVLLCTCLVFLDGFDAQAIGYVAPALIRAWHVPPGQFGPVFSAGLVGLMLGAVFIAPLADKYGRRPVILLSTVLFGICSLLTVMVSSVGTLLVFRLVTGIGLGGCMPNAIALTSEYSPRRHRSLLVMAMFTGFTVGSLVAGLASASLIPRFGWQSVFAVGGVLPLLAAPLMFFALPESLRFLVQSGRHTEQVAGLMRRINPSAPTHPEQRYYVAGGSTARASVGSLFREGRLVSTLLLWTIFFMSLLDIYLLVNWLPTAITAGGATIETAIIVGTMLQVGGLVGPLPLGWLLDRTSARAAMIPAYLLAAACIACIGIFATTSIALTMLAVFGAGFGVLGGQTAANAVSAATYPTRVRSTGVGWALGVGRLGSIIGPALAGIMIGKHVSLHTLFLVSAIPALCAALAAAGLSQARVVDSGQERQSGLV